MHSHRRDETGLGSLYAIYVIMAAGKVRLTRRSPVEKYFKARDLEATTSDSLERTRQAGYTAPISRDAPFVLFRRRLVSFRRFHTSVGYDLGWKWKISGSYRFIVPSL